MHGSGSGRASSLGAEPDSDRDDAGGNFEGRVSDPERGTHPGPEPDERACRISLHHDPCRRHQRDRFDAGSRCACVGERRRRLGIPSRQQQQADGRAGQKNPELNEDCTNTRGIVRNCQPFGRPFGLKCTGRMSGSDGYRQKRNSVVAAIAQTLRAAA